MKPPLVYICRIYISKLVTDFGLHCVVAAYPFQVFTYSQIISYTIGSKFSFTNVRTNLPTYPCTFARSFRFTLTSNTSRNKCGTGFAFSFYTPLFKCIKTWIVENFIFLKSSLLRKFPLPLCERFGISHFGHTHIYKMH